MKRDVAVGLVIIVIVLAAKASTLALPYYWDELFWANGAMWLSDGSLIRALPGLHPPARFGGHPTALHTVLAILFKLCGQSIAVAHGLILVLSAVGLFATYKTSALLYGPVAGVLSAMFLFAMPVYFAQSGMFLADLPVAALGVGCVYLALRQRTFAYGVSATLLLLIKETAVAIVAASAIYVFIRAEGSTRSRVRAALPYASPLLVSVLFILIQRLLTQRWFFVFSEPVALLEVGFAGMGDRILQLYRWVFVEQSRYLLVLLIVLGGCLSSSFRRRREHVLFCLIVLLGVMPYVVVYYLPRYVLLVFPYLCIVAAGALTQSVHHALPRGEQHRGLQRRARLTHGLSLLLGVVVTTVMAVSPSIQADSNHEWNGKYADVIRVWHSAYTFIEQRRALSRPPTCVYATWPHSQQLTHSKFGHVTQPIPIRGLPPDSASTCDIILSSQPGDDTSALSSYARTNGYELAQRWAEGPIVTEVYARPESVSQR